MAQPFHVIPTEVFEAWAKGEYYVGDIPSISYTRLGTALYLRSWYTYANEPSSKNILSGVAKIDIRGPFLSMGGIRLLEESKRVAVFWKTEASHFVSDDEVLWFYSVLNVQGHPTLLAMYLPDWWLDAAKSPASTERFGLDDKQWNTLLDRLRTGFDVDAERIHQQCKETDVDQGMIRFRITPKNDSYLSDYYQFYSDGTKSSLLKGRALFTRSFRA